MDECGLCELWIVGLCDTVGVNTAQKVMTVKGYARSMKTHSELFDKNNAIGTPFDTDDIAKIIISMQSIRTKIIMMTTHTMMPPQLRGQRVTEMKADE